MHRSLAVFSILLFAAAAMRAQTGPPAQSRRLSTATPTEIDAGRRVFAAQCAWCHGNEATGGSGPNLQRATLRHAASDADLVKIVRSGIPGTEMPNFEVSLTNRMAWQTAAYVRSLGRHAPETVAGSAHRGIALYERTGCASCHTVAGKGGIGGPDLTWIGATRGAAYLRESLVDPAASHPPGYLVGHARLSDGTVVRGVIVNEDVFWILLRDVAGTLHTIAKADAVDVAREPDASLMPSYATRLTAVELDDLVAYLTTLRGERGER